MDKIETRSILAERQSVLARKLLAATVTARPGKVARRKLAKGPGSNVVSQHWGKPVN